MKRILITPLDWGLGHATRCIPIIRYLLSRQCEVFIGGSGGALALLRSEFPGLTFFDLPAYNPVYSKQDSMVWKMSLQLPKFFSVIANEHRVIKRIVRAHNIDLVISDNRYGCWSADVPSVFITHQSNILMPQRFGWLGGWIRKINETCINKFTHCWIPDYPEEHSIAGALIRFGKNNISSKVDYLGALSRFETRMNVSRRYDVIGICSGPEPQRTLLETLLRDQFTGSRLTFLLVRGVVKDTEVSNVSSQGTVVNFMTSRSLEEAIQASEIVVARSGYSTVMDMKALGKKAIFIPTPGQTEQEYLARRLKEKGIAFYMPQHRFNLQIALKEMENYTGFSQQPNQALWMGVIDKVLASGR